MNHPRVAKLWQLPREVRLAVLAWRRTDVLAAAVGKYRPPMCSAASYLPRPLRRLWWWSFARLHFARDLAIVRRASLEIAHLRYRRTGTGPRPRRGMYMAITVDAARRQVEDATPCLGFMMGGRDRHFARWLQIASFLLFPRRHREEMVQDILEYRRTMRNAELSLIYIDIVTLKELVDIAARLPHFWVIVAAIGTGIAKLTW